MRNVRVFFQKTGRLKFVSHLDMTRFMTRMFRLSGIPIWYTEGFNKHPYITFALPLSLGFESLYECMDFKLEQDDYTDEQVKTALSAVVPEGITILSAAEPLMKPGKVGFADFTLRFAGQGSEFKAQLDSFLERDTITALKKNKKGVSVEIDLKPKLENSQTRLCPDAVELTVRLPAGGSDNLNPNLLMDAFFADGTKNRIGYSVCRTMLYAEDGVQFS